MKSFRCCIVTVNDVDFEGLSNVGITDELYLEVMGMVLDRSGTHRLDFSINLEENEISVAILRLFACRSQQWRNAEFYGTCPSFSLTNTLSPIRGNLGNLESLTMFVPLHGYMDVFRDAPRL